MQSAAITIQERGQRYAERMAGVSERVLPHLESMERAKILNNARNLEQLDRVALRNFGLDDLPLAGAPINLAILTNQAAVVESKSL